MMDLINFDRNYNGKLNNKYFTSIRNWDKDRVKKNNIYSVSINYKSIFDARLIDYNYDRLLNIPEYVIVTDTGLLYDEAIKLINNIGIERKDFVYLLLFEKVEMVI